MVQRPDPELGGSQTRCLKLEDKALAGIQVPNMFAVENVDTPGAMRASAWSVTACWSICSTELEVDWKSGHLTIYSVRVRVMNAFTGAVTSILSGVGGIQRFYFLLIWFSETPPLRLDLILKSLPPARHSRHSICLPCAAL